MYNFLDPKLLPKVATITTSLEGYEPTNLISENPLTKSRGFLAYSCIKPPIDIDFELICPICIHYISVSCKLGTQRVVGVEVQAKNNGPEYTTIAHGYFNEDNAVFCNLRYYTKSNPPNTSTSDVYLGFFKGHLYRVFTNAKFIRVRILRTERSTPCLGPVEIWGQVAKSCPKITAETIVKLMTKKPNKVENNVPIENIKLQVGEFEICDDFKDALTFEIMAIPMTLPSGHSVDQSTLERCARNDSTYGRHCCDPFTGLPFTVTRKPKLNVALKNRIDMFLLQNAHRKETFGISRTVGKIKNHDKVYIPKCSDLMDNNKIKTDSQIKRLSQVSSDNKTDDYNINNKRIKLDCPIREKNNCTTSYLLGSTSKSNMLCVSGNAKILNNFVSVNVTKDKLNSITSLSSDYLTRNKKQSARKGVLNGEKLEYTTSNSTSPKNDPDIIPSRETIKHKTFTSSSHSTKNNNHNFPESNTMCEQNNKHEYLQYNSSNCKIKNSASLKFNYVPSGSDHHTICNEELIMDSDNSALDAAIAKVMNSRGFVTFTKENEDRDSEVDVEKCCVCDNCNNLYGLPCLHLYCRTCLLDVCKKSLCKDCDVQFCRSDVKKIHKG